MVPDGKEFSEEELNAIAGTECNCSAAEEEREIGNIKDAAAESIEKILVKKERSTAAGILSAAIDPIARKKVKKVSVNMDGELVCSMYMKGKKIIVEARQTMVEYSDGEAIDE
jgi:hypothetical protein